MTKKSIIFIIIFGTLLLSPRILPADETHINVNVDNKGMADEQIKLKEYELKTKEHLEEKEKAERIKQSEEFRKTADMYYSNGELGMAAEYYQKAIDANENNVKAHESLLKVQREISTHEAKGGSHYARAMEYLRMGLSQKAIDELVAELKENPGNEEARMQLNAIENQKEIK